MNYINYFCCYVALTQGEILMYYDKQKEREIEIHGK